MNDTTLTIIYAFAGGVFGTSIGALWAFILCTLLAMFGSFMVLQGGDGYFLSYVALGPIFGPAVGGFLSGVVASTYAAGVRKNHPTNNGKDIITPLVGTSWDVLVVGGLTAVVSLYLMEVLKLIPFLNQSDIGAISIIIISLVTRVLFLKEGVCGKKESIKEFGLFGTNNYAISWVGWQSPPAKLAVMGISFGAFSGAIVAGMQGLLNPLVEQGSVDKGTAHLVCLFFTWALSGVMLTMLCLSEGDKIKVPVTHAIGLVASLVFLHTEPLVGANNAILFAMLGGLTAVIFQEIGARLFYNHGGNHVDPPAFSIAVNVFIYNIFFFYFI